MPHRFLVAPILLTALILSSPTSIHAQPPAHKGPAAAIALAKTVQPFDVVSVKPNKSGGQSWGMKFGDTGITATNVTLEFLIQYAYDIKPNFIQGLSGPVSSAHFDVEAKVVPQDGSTPKVAGDQLLAMVIPLLADRFHLQAHLESQIKPTYDLVTAKGGPRIKLSQDEIHDSNWNTSFEGTNKVITAKGIRMPDLADALSNLAGRKVIDKTGLAGHADITLKWSDDVAAQQGGPGVMSIFTALEDELGLKLQPSKSPVDTLVIDHAEMPTEN